MVLGPTDKIVLFPFPGLSTIEMEQNKLYLTENPLFLSQKIGLKNQNEH